MNNEATRTEKIASIATSPNGVLIETIKSLRTNDTNGVTLVLAELYTQIEKSRPFVEAHVAGVFDREEAEGREYSDLIIEALRAESRTKFMANSRR